MTQPTQSRRNSQKSLIIWVLGLFLLCLASIAAGSVLLSEGYFLSVTFSAVNPELPTISAVVVTDDTSVKASTTPTIEKKVLAPKAKKEAEIPIAVTLPKVQSESSFGISVADTLTGLSAEELGRRLDDIVSLHIGWLRLDIDWSVIQRRDRDAFDWSRVDRVVKAARARGLKLLPILVYTPEWARAEGCESNRCPPRAPELFSDFAVAAVKRYAPSGIHHWEIWNEPNMRGSWMGAADPVDYAALLRSAYASIKKEDPSATVITGGLSPIATNDGNIAPREYLSAIYREGARSSFDAVGFHPYSFPVTASYDAPWNAWQQMTNTTSSLRSIMIAYGDGSKRIWMTEYGAPTDGPGDVATLSLNLEHHTDHVTEELQAAMVVDAIEQIRNYSWAGPLFWYSYKDLGTSSHTTENFYGLIRSDGTHKPAYDALLKALVSGH